MVEIRNMSFGYRKKRLFSGLDLTLQPGNIYGLLGKNGAGKTTLLKIISGLRLAQEGSCSVLGFDPARRPAPLLEEICFIAEELYVPALSPDMFDSPQRAPVPALRSRGIPAPSSGSSSSRPTRSSRSSPTGRRRSS